MNRLLACVMCAAVAVAQTPSASLSISGPPVAPSGAAVILTVTLNSGGGPAGIQWDMSGIPSGATVTSAVAGKTANCTAALTRCILSGTNATAIPDGAVATIKFTQPASTVGAGLVNTLGASPAGASVAIAAPLSPLTIGVQSNCDLNADGKVDATDEGLMLQQALAATTGTPTVLDVIRVIIAANGGACLR